MEREYLDFDVALVPEDSGLSAQVVASPAGMALSPFALPFSAVELAGFIGAVGPPSVATRRLVPAATTVLDVEDYGRRLGDALLTGEVDRLFRESLGIAKGQGRDLRLRLRLDAAPDLEGIPWEYLYDARLGRFLTLSRQTPVVRVIDALDEPPAVPVVAPMRILVMISSPTDLPPLDVDREKQLLLATTGDLVQSGRLAVDVISDATLTALQRALLEPYHVFHFIGHGGFDRDEDAGVLALEREDGTADHVAGARLATLLHDAPYLQLAVLNACEGARTSGRNAFAGVAQMLVRQGLPAVVAMQTAISDRAALVFSHEFYYFLSRGLPIDAAICEVRKAMATSDQSAEWGTPVLLRSGSGQPFDMRTPDAATEPAPESRWASLYAGAQEALGSPSPEAAVPILEQLAAEKPDYADVTQLLARVQPSTVQQSPSSVQQFPSTVQQFAATVQEPPLRVQHQGKHRGRGVVVGAGVLGLAVLGGFLGLRMFGPPTPDDSLTATHVTTAPVIDGSFDEWASVPAIEIGDVVYEDKATSHPDPVSGTWRTAWDAQGLYIQVSVRDSNFAPVDRLERTPSQYWQGDGVSFEFGPDARSLSATDGLRAGRDVHVLLGMSSRGPLAAVNPVGQDPKGTPVFVSGRAEGRITALGGLTADGYALEARIPWSVLHVTTPPSAGAVFAANENISDANASQTGLGVMVSSNPQRSGPNQNHPGTWQHLVLGS